jgi:hypothetical protein
MIRESASGSLQRIGALMRRAIGRVTRSARTNRRTGTIDALAQDIQALRAEIDERGNSLRAELHAFAGSLHAATIARLDGLEARVESDLMVLLKFRRTPDSELESELTDSMRLVIEAAVAEIRQALLDRSDLNVRVLEQELVRVTSRLERRLDEISSGRGRLLEASDRPSVPLAPDR